MLRHPRGDRSKFATPMEAEFPSSDDELYIEPLRPGETFDASFLRAPSLLTFPSGAGEFSRDIDCRKVSFKKNSEWNYRRVVDRLSPEFARHSGHARCSTLPPRRPTASDWEDGYHHSEDRRDDEHFSFESLQRDIQSWEEQGAQGSQPTRGHEGLRHERFRQTRSPPQFWRRTDRSSPPLETSPRGRRGISRDYRTSRKNSAYYGGFKRRSRSPQFEFQSRGSLDERRWRLVNSPNCKRPRRDTSSSKQMISSPKPRSRQRSPSRYSRNWRDQSPSGRFQKEERSSSTRWGRFRLSLSPCRDDSRRPRKSHSRDRVRASNSQSPSPKRARQDPFLCRVESKNLAFPTSLSKQLTNKSSEKTFKKSNKNVKLAPGSEAKGSMLAEQRALIDSLLGQTVHDQVAPNESLEEKLPSILKIQREESQFTDSKEKETGERYVTVTSRNTVDPGRTSNMTRDESGSDDLRSFLRARHSKMSPQGLNNGCVCCSSTSHQLENCPEFLSLDPHDRCKIVEDFAGVICSKCLNVGHIVSQCTSNVTCLHEKCTRDGHHTLLHLSESLKEVANVSDSVQDLLTNIRQKETTMKKQFFCVECQGPHHEINCPDNFCRKCKRKGHKARDCPTYCGDVCFVCKSPDHMEKNCPQRLMECGKYGHLTTLCQPHTSSVCSTCKSEDHTSRECPECSFCQKRGHDKEDCLLLLSKKTGVKYCRKCENLGHFSAQCTKYPQQICFHCKSEEHSITNCPSIACTLCQKVGHISAACPQNETLSMCRQSDQSGHHERSCPTYPQPICYISKSEGHEVSDCLSSTCRNCNETGHSMKQCQAKTKTIFCTKCNIPGHKIENCPFLECRNCGTSSHTVQNCRNKKNEFRQRRLKEQDKRKNVISVEYHHSPPSEQMNCIELPTKTMTTHFQEKLQAKGCNPDLASQMMLYWHLAEQNEESLRDLFYRNAPCSRDTLRLLLVSILANVPSTARPMDVNTSELIDGTIEFFMPTPRIGIVQTPSSSTIPPMKKEIQDSSAFDSSLRSLEPLREFIIRKMKSLSDLFGIQESYIIEVATSIQKLLAEIGLCLYTLRRHFIAGDKNMIGSLIQERAVSAQTKLPDRVSSAYVAALVTDFAVDFFK